MPSIDVWMHICARILRIVCKPSSGIVKTRGNTKTWIGSMCKLRRMYGDCVVLLRAQPWSERVTIIDIQAQAVPSSLAGICERKLFDFTSVCSSFLTLLSGRSPAPFLLCRLQCTFSGCDASVLYLSFSLKQASAQVHGYFPLSHKFMFMFNCVTRAFIRSYAPVRLLARVACECAWAHRRARI